MKYILFLSIVMTYIIVSIPIVVDSFVIQNQRQCLKSNTQVDNNKLFIPKGTKNNREDVIKTESNIQTNTEASAAAAEADTVTTSVHIFLDIEVTGELIGRLIFIIPNIKLLPIHIDNIIKLCTQERTSIDPRCKYIGCTFDHSPQFVEGYAQYRWGHTLHGNGQNAVVVVGGGRRGTSTTDRISDPDNMRLCIHRIYGGQYYGLNYNNDVPKYYTTSTGSNSIGQEQEQDDCTVVLAVPLVGPGRGLTDISIIRVGESPKEWKELLLLNTAVIGWLDPLSLNTLRTMAQQTRGPPKVINSGILETV